MASSPGEKESPSVFAVFKFMTGSTWLTRSPSGAQFGAFSRIQLPPVAPDPIMERAPEILRAPAADAVVGIGRDIGRVDRVEAALHWQTAGKWRAARGGVACGAVC
jgi:hypothetical protein